MSPYGVILAVFILLQQDYKFKSLCSINSFAAKFITPNVKLFGVKLVFLLKFIVHKQTATIVITSNEGVHHPWKSSDNTDCSNNESSYCGLNQV